ncbi:MAG: hypothetical protein Q7T07_12220 [Burkholderiaceae bacterium]|nr:hypothetical protein [Burkholderiaceae bacterium]
MKNDSLSLTFHPARVALAALGSTVLFSPFIGNAQAQTQVVKPPVAQYWMDVATVSIAGMEEMPSMGAMGGLMGGMTGMGSVNFGATRGMMPGRWLDLAVVTQRKPAGTEATQSIPEGQRMGPSLTLLPVQAQPRATGGRQSVDEIPERPKGRILFYWGCGDTVRAGQPRVLDFSTAGAEDYGKFMMGRAVRDQGAKAEPGHAIWPNEKHRQSIPRESSLSGQHALGGEGIPPSLKFSITQPQDFMPPLALNGSGGGTNPTGLSWQILPTASAYFLNAMSGGGSGTDGETVIWSSSEVQEPGWGLMDYASNANVDRWLKDKVLLPNTQTRCAIPAGIFAKSKGAVVRGIAYGQELNLSHPPRPADKRVAWEPEWAARVRVKSVAMLPLGEDGPTPKAQEEKSRSPDTPGTPGMPGMPGLGRALKGLFGN